VIPQRKSLARGCATLVVAAFLATGCSSSKSTPSTTPPASTPSSAGTTSSAASGNGPADEAGAKQAITDLFNNYFDSTKDASTKTDLVQNGAKMNNLVAALAKAAQAQKSSVAVKSVSFTSPTHAAITFDILLNGTPALPNAQGQALLDSASGKWQVADATLCQLAGITPGVAPDLLKSAGCTS
jgi:hypothetical protein